MLTADRGRPHARSRGWISLVRVAVPLAVAGAAALALAPFARRTGASEGSAEGALVRRGPLRIAAVTSGHLAAAETVRLASAIEGRTTILSIVPEGSQVREGEVVCELDATAMVEQRIQQRITLGNAEASLVKARQTLEFAEQDLLVFVEGERARLRAPGDGYVVCAQRDSDEPPIQAGAKVREREEILSIPSSGGMIANVKLHESVLQQVRAGQPCRVTVDALQGAVVEGSVAFVAMLPDQNSRWSNPNLGVYQTTIAITTAHPGLRPGMSCSIEILIEELEEELFVPLQSVFREGDASVC
jgi:multidrug resistance efflux pump